MNGSDYAFKGMPTSILGAFHSHPGGLTANPGITELYPDTSATYPGTTFVNPGTSFVNPGISFDNPGTFNANSGLPIPNQDALAAFDATATPYPGQATYHPAFDTTNPGIEKSPPENQLPSPATTTLSFETKPKLKFQNMKAAQEALHSKKQQVMAIDPTLPQTDEEQRVWVAEIVRCMCSTEGVTDNEGLVRAWEKTVVDKGEQIEIRAWELLVRLPLLSHDGPCRLTSRLGHRAGVPQLRRSARRLRNRH